MDAEAVVEPVIVHAETLPKNSAVISGRHRTKSISRRSEALLPLVLHGGIVVLSLTFARAAHAYIGPGLGLSQIGIALSAIGGFLFFLSAAIWYPFKRMLRRRRAKRAAASRHDGEPPASTGVGDSLE